MLEKVVDFLNKKHGSNYIVYNLYRDRQLDSASGLFHQVTEYPFPKACMAEGLSPKDPRLLQFTTPPPTLRQLFLVVLEMASWINNACSGDEKHIVVLH